MKICGPKLSLCWLIISVWGIIQLVLMGIFYYFHSVALFEDLPIDEEEYSTRDKLPDFITVANNAYSQNAYNCWIAACIYIFTLILSAHQFYMNSRATAN